MYIPTSRLSHNCSSTIHMYGSALLYSTSIVDMNRMEQSVRVLGVDTWSCDYHKHMFVVCLGKHCMANISFSSPSFRKHASSGAAVSDLRQQKHVPGHSNTMTALLCPTKPIYTLITQQQLPNAQVNRIFALAVQPSESAVVGTTDKDTKECVLKHTVTQYARSPDSLNFFQVPILPNNEIIRHGRQLATRLSDTCCRFSGFNSVQILTHNCDRYCKTKQPCRVHSQIERMISVATYLFVATPNPLYLGNITARQRSGNQLLTLDGGTRINGRNAECHTPRHSRNNC